MLPVRLRRWLCVLALTVAPLLPAWLGVQFKDNARGSASFHDASAIIEIEVAAAVALDTVALWVDARSSIEYRRQHWRDALSLNASNWDDQLPVLLAQWSPGRPVLVYCDADSCFASRRIAKDLIDGGVRPTYVVRGGWMSLKEYCRP